LGLAVEETSNGGNGVELELLIGVKLDFHGASKVV
jgi:hypothetical protein